MKEKDPEIKPGTIWVTLLMGFTFQVRGLEELERRAKESFKKLLPRKQRPPSADTIRNSCVGMKIEPIKKLYTEVVNKAPTKCCWPVVIIEYGHWRDRFIQQAEPLLPCLPGSASPEWDNNLPA